MEQILKYVWVVNIINRAGKNGISLTELNEKWKNHTDLSRGEELNRQTFSRWKSSLEELFSIIIDCDRKNGYRYYISNVEELENGGVSRWLFDTYATASTLSHRMSLRERILVDNMPSSNHHLGVIMDAMQDNKVLQITYRRFGSEATTFEAEPYCVKLFCRRWYLLARNCNKNRLSTYGLDRIEELNATEKRFTLPEDFDAEGYFSDSFGIVVEKEVQVQDIVIRVRNGHQNYLRTLPLHYSQRELCDTGEYADFKLTLRPTYDFIMELLSKGGLVEVIEPKSLRKEMKGWVEEMWNYYRKEK